MKTRYPWLSIACAAISLLGVAPRALAEVDEVGTVASAMSETAAESTTAESTTAETAVAEPVAAEAVAAPTSADATEEAEAGRQGASNAVDAEPTGDMPSRRQTVRAEFFPSAEAPPLVELGAAIEPWPLSPPFACARSALVEADAKRAMNCLQGATATTSPERYIHALALERAARPKEAAPILDALAADYAPLADHCRYLAGKSFEAIGSVTDALRSYESVASGSSLADDARLGQARMLRRLGRHAEAIDLLMPIADRPRRNWGRDVVAEAIFAVAETRADMGEKAAAAALFLKVWSDHARSPLSGPALDRAQALQAAPTVEHRVRRAESLLQQHRNQQALDMIRPFVETPPATLSESGLCRARSVMGRALRKLRRHAQAVEVLAPLVDNCAPDDAWAAGVYTAGMSATHLEPARAIDFYLRLEEVLPESALADDALFLAAGIHEREGAHRKARRLLRRLILCHPTGDYRAEALFQLAWISRKEGLLFEALDAFESVERDYFDRDLDAAVRARYWKARVLDELGRADEATANFEAIAALHPAGFYGLLARTQLGQRPPADSNSNAEFNSNLNADASLTENANTNANDHSDAKATFNSESIATENETPEGAKTDTASSQPSDSSISSISNSELTASDNSPLPARSNAEENSAAPLKLLPDAPPPMMVRALADDPRLVSAIELLRLGFSQEAADELLRIERLPLRHPHPPEDLATLTRLIATTPRARSAHVVARNDLKRLLLTAPESRWMPVWKAAYPQFFRGEIESRAVPLALDPDLLQALIREESAFDARAGSWAGAMGLCQLMMPTAKEVAGWLGVRGPLTRARLCEPDLNIWMGATYLSHLLQRFRGNAALAVAAYNAGAGAVRKFLRLYEGDALDEFIEEIPYEETRHYVKRVLGTMATYQMLYERDLAPMLGRLKIEVK